MNTPSTILVVEHDDPVRRFSLHVLRQHGFRTLEAFDGETGLAAFLRHKHEVDLIITDVVMPQRSGPEMVETVLTVQPSAKVVFMSGTAESSEMPPRLQELPILYKPFTADRLVKIVRRSLDVRNDSVAGWRGEEHADGPPMTEKFSTRRAVDELHDIGAILERSKTESSQAHAQIQSMLNELRSLSVPKTQRNSAGRRVHKKELALPV